MPKGCISEVLTPDARKEIADAIATLKRRLPFLLALAPKERQSMVKLGPKSVKFVSNVKRMGLDNPDLVPNAFDFPEFVKDVELVEALDPFAGQLSALAQGTEDTRMIAGSEAMTTALRLYEVFKAERQVVPGPQPALDELGARFKKRGGKGPRTPKE